MKVAVGGTFDHFHDGHKRLLVRAASYGLPIVIGLTTEPLLGKKKYKEYIEDYSVRKESVEEFLDSLPNHAPFEVVPLAEPYGPTTSDREISVLVVTEETNPTALEINKIRESRRFPLLKIDVIDTVVDDRRNIACSTNIRKVLFEKDLKRVN